MQVPTLSGRTAVITGATGGIGQTIARQFARQGASVVLVGRNQVKLERIVKELGPRGRPEPKTHAAVCFDVCEANGWKSLVENTQIDILINCAGETQQSLLLRTSEESIQHLLDLNLRSVVWGCKTVGKQMVARRRKGGCIINISSLLAYRAVIGTSIYAAAKAGQIGLTTALSQEFGRHGIRVNAIVPGYIDTAMTKDLDKKELIKRIPLGRFGTPGEVAHAALFLAKNNYANNCILHLDGGLSAV
ncbi:NAD(P)-binding protein [Parathielavia appendiculata]|uniref:NAD(P)-binding protein n=1 Tax=Parathielavia appendiculata TaxID=2587402 RepID=A0AAN6TUD1_9PEZI|nr:NAD(P)-binding protein [Parathielavia appendiculata]